MSTLGQRLADTPILPRLGTLLMEVRSGEVGLPVRHPMEIDREAGSPWTGLLLDSLVRGLPLGTFTTWRAIHHRLRTQGTIGRLSLPTREPSPTRKQTYLVDGGQRIAALLGVFYPREGEELFYADLTADREVTFRGTYGRRDPFPEHMLPMSLVGDGGDKLYGWCQAQRAAGHPSLERRATNLINVFLDRVVLVQPIVTDDITAVADTVARINGRDSEQVERYRAGFMARVQENQ